VKKTQHGFAAFRFTEIKQNGFDVFVCEWFDVLFGFWEKY
jgi:hypothetical protein